MKLEFEATITDIMHDYIHEISKVYFNHGKDEVILIRPMKKRYEWKINKKGETISRGRKVKITITADADEAAL